MEKFIYMIFVHFCETGRDRLFVREKVILLYICSGNIIRL